MKPIHHALVSARLFGGVPEDYVSVHNAFDMSKAAHADMRHRAALHSVDHGAAVMQLIFPERIGSTTLSDVCVQHVNDDQGFSVTLDTWLKDCPAPVYELGAVCPAPSLQAFRSAPEEACAKRFGGHPEDYAQICAYYALPEQMSDHPMAPAISRNAFAIYFSEMAFGPALSITLKNGKQKYVATRDIGECIALARYGKVLTLGEVLADMPKQDWMYGSRVARSRKRREAAAGRADLFSEETVGIPDLDAACSSEAAIKVILSD